MANALPDVPSLLDTLAKRCGELIAERCAEPLVVGVRTGGLWVAEALMARLALPGTLGEIDIGFHRDDFHQRGLQRGIQPTRIATTEGRNVLLVDDVLHSGRTARAALNALFEFGRPRHVAFAVLVDRNGRELPIQADAAATRVTLPEDARLKLRNEGGLHLELAGAKGVWSDP